MAITLDGTSGITAPTYAGSVSAEYSVPVTAFKNRIINGAMMIDQRNAGASVTNTVSTANALYTLDRWGAWGNVASKYTIQQNAGSVTPPSGYTNYLGITSASSYSVLSSDFFFISQIIEGFNVADLGWGAAGAATVTLSFWTRSSLTGTFGGSITNGAENRSYPFSYTISAANTWEQKTITIAGDTSGTWLKTNGAGLKVWFGLGVGSTYSGTAGSWAGAGYYSATGATSVVGTSGATLYITGVQLEKGSTATSFDYRPYGTELQLCQRYYWRMIGGAGGFDPVGSGVSQSTTIARIVTKFPVTMRTYPTAVEQSGTATHYNVYANGSSINCNSVPTYNAASTEYAETLLSTAASQVLGQGANGRIISTSGYLAWSAEL